VTPYRYSPYPALVAPCSALGRQPTSCCKMSATVSHEIAVLVVAPTSKTPKSRATTSRVLRLVGPLSRVYLLHAFQYLSSLSTCQRSPLRHLTPSLCCRTGSLWSRPGEPHVQPCQSHLAARFRARPPHNPTASVRALSFCVVPSFAFPYLDPYYYTS